jgi:methyl-accepting chemotaxis protein
MFKNTHWLEITELGVVILTVIGIIVAVVSQQLIYALILLTILMLVNILNRRRLEQVIRRHNRNRTVQLDELKAAVNNFSQSLNQPANNPNLLSPDQVNALLVSIRTLQDGQQTLAQAIAPMQNQLYKLITDFHDRPELKETQDLAQIILALQNSLNQFPALGSIEQRITHLEEILTSEEQI